MADIPIIFSGPMIIALLAGRKTMTRRLAWKMDCGNRVEWSPSPWQRVKPGDRLWVRENLGFEFSQMRPIYSAKNPAVAGPVEYVPDPPAEFCGPMAKYTRSRPCIHMPRWASRLTLVVTATKIERLQAISEADCIAEGAEIVYLHGNPVDDGPMVCLSPYHVYGTPRTWFRELWDRLHGAGAWDANPELVALTFTVYQKNIDAMKDAA